MRRFYIGRGDAALQMTITDLLMIFTVNANEFWHVIAVQTIHNVSPSL